jgi:hypothetical protein
MKKRYMFRDSIMVDLIDIITLAENCKFIFLYKQYSCYSFKAQWLLYIPPTLKFNISAF